MGYYVFWWSTHLTWDLLPLDVNPKKYSYRLVLIIYLIRNTSAFRATKEPHPAKVRASFAIPSYVVLQTNVYDQFKSLVIPIGQLKSGLTLPLTKEMAEELDFFELHVNGNARYPLDRRDDSSSCQEVWHQDECLYPGTSMFSVSH